MSYETVSKFQKEQTSAVANIGAFVTCLDSFIEKIQEGGGDENAEIRRMQPLVGEFLKWAHTLHKFLNEYHYVAYYKPIGSSANSISVLLANQTMPSTKVSKDNLLSALNAARSKISEAMMAISQIISSPIDANLVAGNAFSAYCFLRALIDSSEKEVVIIDPYLDKSVFYRYLTELDKKIAITLITDSRKLKGEKLVEFESVEHLFKRQYVNYRRTMHADLHDRYIINEVKAYNLGGSIAHAAFKSDFSVVEVSSDRRLEMLAKYA